MEIKAAQFWASASAGCFLRAGQVLPVKAVVEFWRSASPQGPRCCQVPPRWFPRQRPQLGGTIPIPPAAQQSSTELHALVCGPHRDYKMGLHMPVR